MIRPFIKWAGGKSRVMPKLLPYLPKAGCLIEPFVGGASVFLNTDYRRYILADINPDLILMYRFATQATEDFISLAQPLFLHGNSAGAYEVLRKRFNELPASEERAALFLYLNRHCFNGVCRYNAKGIYNVPFGKHKNPPYFPIDEIRLFAEKAKDTHTQFICAPFQNTISVMAESDTAIYCDPPYIPISATANFTQYSKEPFGRAEHMRLVTSLLAVNLSHGSPVVISNSDTPLTREIYRHFNLHSFSARRSISSKASQREDAKEVIGVLSTCKHCGKYACNCVQQPKHISPAYSYQ